MALVCSPFLENIVSGAFWTLKVKLPAAKLRAAKFRPFSRLPFKHVFKHWTPSLGLKVCQAVTLQTVGQAKFLFYFAVGQNFWLGRFCNGWVFQAGLKGIGGLQVACQQDSLVKISPQRLQNVWMGNRISVREQSSNHSLFINQVRSPEPVRKHENTSCNFKDQSSNCQSHTCSWASNPLCH